MLQIWQAFIGEWTLIKYTGMFNKAKNKNMIVPCTKIAASPNVKHWGHVLRSQSTPLVYENIIKNPLIILNGIPKKVKLLLKQI